MPACNQGATTNMATTKVDPNTVYCITAKGTAALAKAQAAVTSDPNTHSNNRKLVAMAAAGNGATGATGTVLRNACNAAGDGLYAGHAIGRNGWFAPKAVAPKAPATK